MLARLREVYAGDKFVEVPSLRSKDSKQVMKEVRLINSLMHNIISENMGVDDVNRLLYAGSFVVAERLGLFRQEKKDTLKRKKPHWQRRIERNIVEWRKDLSRVEEIRKGTAVRKRIR